MTKRFFSRRCGKSGLPVLARRGLWLALWCGLSCGEAAAQEGSGAVLAPLLPIEVGQSWRFFRGTQEPPERWNHSDFDASSWELGASGIGYGTDLVQTSLTDMRGRYTSVYLRRRFHLPVAAEADAFLLTMDFDDGFVAYINGVEVARAHVEGEPPPFDGRARRVRSPGRPADFRLEGLQNILLDGTNVLAIHGFNSSIRSIDFAMIPALRVVNSPPRVPTESAPRDGESVAEGVVLLSTEVFDPERRPVDVKFYGRRLDADPPQDFTIVALPDTQFYSESYPEVFAAQTEWIVNNKERLNIVFTTQLGDCVQNSNAREVEWQNADAAMRRLEDPETTNLLDGIPYGIAVGNHDNTGNPGTLEDEGSTTPLYNKYFGIARFEGRQYYGGHYGINNDNHYQLFDAGGVPFLALHLEYDQAGGPLREAVLDWADRILEEHADRTAILSAHYLLNPNASFSAQGDAVYERLKGRSNLVLMLCGHLNEAARRVDEYEGHSIHTVLSDYQGGVAGGNGWLRIMRYSFERREFSVETYSPWLDRFKNPGEPHNFTLPIDLDPGPDFELLGELRGVPGDGVTSFPWKLSRADAVYEWLVEVSDGEHVTRSPRWSFSRASGPDCADLTPQVDCNANDVADSCDLALGPFGDCDGNGRLDTCDLAIGTSLDCNGNAYPDECEALADCDQNGVADSCEVLEDCDGNAVPDACELAERDCNRNGVLDACDLLDGTSLDCDLDAVPDECEEEGPAVECGDLLGTRFIRGDCNGDGVVEGTVADAVFLLNYLFRGGLRPPPCLLACDTNGDGDVLGVVTDATYLLHFTFLGGPQPPPPFPECGEAGIPALATLGCLAPACP